METEIIREGLKLALSRGETLQKAMQSFYDAGYNKEEIEQAAISLKSSSDSLNSFLQNSKVQSKSNSFEQSNSGQPIQKTQVSTMKKTETQINQKIQESKQLNQTFQGGNDFSKRNLIIAFVLIMLFLAAIISIIYYKDQVIVFINNLIGENV